MKRHNPESVGDILRDLLQETSLQGRIDELKAIDLWPRIVGREIADLAGKPGVKNGIMAIGIPNASLRHELHMNRSSIRDLINQTLGKEIIHDIRFTS